MSKKSFVPVTFGDGLASPEVSLAFSRSLLFTFGDERDTEGEEKRDTEGEEKRITKGLSHSRSEKRHLW